MFAVDLCCDVEPQPIGTVVLEVHPGVLIEVVSQFLLPPSRATAPVGHLPTFKVDTAFVSIPIKLPENVVTGASMVVHHVEDNGQTMAMCCIDETLEILWRAIG